jgi:hypothetical protein
MLRDVISVHLPGHIDPLTVDKVRRIGVLGIFVCGWEPIFFSVNLAYPVSGIEVLYDSEDRTVTVTGVSHQVSLRQIKHSVYGRSDNHALYFGFLYRGAKRLKGAIYRRFECSLFVIL